MPRHVFFTSGDEWGLVSIVPAENHAWFADVRRRYFEHHKDTEFGSNGWLTPPFVIPEPAVPISVRGLRVAELDELFSPALPRADVVETCVDFTGPVYEESGCFAFGVGERFRAQGVYGSVNAGVVDALHVSNSEFEPGVAARLADALVALGTRHDLILLDHAERLVDLRQRAGVFAYLIGRGSE